MSNKDNRLSEVLAAYGADPRRWPAADRSELAALIRPESQEWREAAALDRLLATASQPLMPAAASDRLLMKVHGTRNVSARRVFRWSTALPLAASLLLGIYLGAVDSIDPWLPAEETLAADDDADLSGVGEAETYAAENLS